MRHAPNIEPLAHPFSFAAGFLSRSTELAPIGRSSQGWGETRIPKELQTVYKVLTNRRRVSFNFFAGSHS
jgi:hypothetical protein